MTPVNLFETVLLISECHCDNQQILKDVKHHQTQVKSVQLSNNGGYQGHYFESQTLFELIRELVPQRPDRKLISFDIQAWINVNYRFAWNDVHTHSDDGVLISGIYYVSIPENSGNIKFYDPRFLKGLNTYDRYYFEGQGNFIKIQPKECMMLMFPPWLPHSVDPNMSESDRISIAFNIVNIITDK